MLDRRGETRLEFVESSMFSKPQTSIPRSYKPIFSNHCFEIVKRPPAWAGDSKGASVAPRALTGFHLKTRSQSKMPRWKSPELNILNVLGSMMSITGEITVELLAAMRSSNGGNQS